MNRNKTVIGEPPVIEASEWLGPISGRVPYARHVEDRALGAMLKHSQYIQQLGPDYFHHPLSRKLFVVLAELDAEAVKITADRVRQELATRSLLEVAEPYLDRLLAMPERPKAEIERALEILYRKTISRAAMRFGHELIQQAPLKCPFKLYDYVQQGAVDLIFSN